MRVITVDQFEFSNAGSEESLEIALSSMGRAPIKTVAQFLQVRLRDLVGQTGAPVPFSEQFGYQLVRPYLRQFAAVELPQPCDWPTYVVADGPNEWRLILCGPALLIDYGWLSTA